MIKTRFSLIIGTKVKVRGRCINNIHVLHKKVFRKKLSIHFKLYNILQLLTFFKEQKPNRFCFQMIKVQGPLITCMN